MADHVRVGLSSYTYPWAIGLPGAPVTRPLDHDGLLDRTAGLGAAVLQVADNLPLHPLDRTRLLRLRDRARDLGVDLEVGTRGVEPELLARYLEIATLVGSPLLRTVVDRGGHEPTPAEAVATLRPLAPAFRRAGIVLALENHDRLSSRALAWVVEELGTDWVGVCLDTVNSLGALEGPDVVVGVLGPLAVNLHVKDFDVVRANASLGFDVRGRPVGGGRLDLDALLPRLTRPGPLTAVV